MVASSGIPSKLRRLRRLRKTIIQETYVDLWKNVWFYPSCMGVRGWEGTQDIMFVGLNPSTGRFPSKDDKFLYSQLMEHHFEAAHLTDLIKLRATGQEAQAWYKAITKNQIEEEEQFKLLGRQQDYLREEVAILSPLLVVAEGKSCARLLQHWLGDEVQIDKIPHYAPRIRSPENRGVFVHELARVQARYQRLKG
jgi:hypothetical protein